MYHLFYFDCSGVRVAVVLLLLKTGAKTRSDITFAKRGDVDALGDSTLHRAPCTSHMYDKPRLQNLAHLPTATI
jgi:hypothetical protein